MLLNNDKGQMLPFIAFMMIIVLLFAAFTIGITMMFLERKKVEDALDTAVLSASLTDVQHRTVATYYGDGLSWVCTAGYWDDYTYTDSDGNEHSGSDWVCTDGYYRVVEHEGSHRNCIYFSNKGSARNYFEKNLAANSSKAKIENLSLELEYDDERFLKVVNAREYMNPPGSYGSYPVVGSSSDPTWWHGDYGGTTGFLGQPPSFNITNDTEERIVRFPRWVKINATAKVKIPSLMANILGSENTALVTVHSETVRELLRIDKPYYTWPEVDDDD